MLTKDMIDFSFLNVFKKDDATHYGIAHAGEKLLLKLYGATTATGSLNKQR